MNQETRTCQNCKQNFVIEPDDFNFYEKIKVPPPTFCPECRLTRRLSWRNERTLYKRKCDLCSASIIASYPANAKFPAYCHDCWYSDKWDPLSYGQNYDFSKPFFEQFGELYNRVPRMNMWQMSVTNSPYASIARECKDCYLCYSLVGGEQVYYSKTVDYSFRVFDSLSINSCENCYENIYGYKNYESSFLFRSRNCMNSLFLFDCVNCSNCILSSNLRNKEFYIRNKPYSKENYEKEKAKLDFGKFDTLEKYKKEFGDLIKSSLHKYADIIKSTDSTGDNLINTKNAKDCFDSHDVEDARYCHRALELKNSYDSDYGGLGSELVYEYISGSKNCYDMKFSTFGLGPLKSVNYSDFCSSCSNIFGCTGLRNSEFCILNKKYEEGIYFELIEKIKNHMQEKPYNGQNGRVYGYGEFLPVEISPFAYNETLAQEYFPLTKTQAEARGFKWKDPEEKRYEITKGPKDLPNSIDEVKDDLLKSVIGCSHGGRCNEQCTMAFKVVEEELKFYKKMGLPIPRLCPNCRHYGRLKQINPMKLWKRNCMCSVANNKYKNTTKHFHNDQPCPNQFKTSYAPDRSETVYCEQCYNAEVV